MSRNSVLAVDKIWVITYVNDSFVILTLNRCLLHCTHQAVDIKCHVVQSKLKSLEQLKMQGRGYILPKSKMTAMWGRQRMAEWMEEFQMLCIEKCPILLIWTCDWTPVLWRTSLRHRHHHRWGISHTSPQMPPAQCTGSGRTHSCPVRYTFCHLLRHTQLFLLSSYSCLQCSQPDIYTPHSDNHHDL